MNPRKALEELLYIRDDMKYEIPDKPLIEGIAEKASQVLGDMNERDLRKLNKKIDKYKKKAIKTMKKQTRNKGRALSKEATTIVAQLFESKNFCMENILVYYQLALKLS